MKGIKHKLIYATLRPLVTVYLKLKFGYTYQKAHDLPENYIVLSNHTTDFDPLFVAASFPKQMYFVASEHVARWKLAYKFLKFGFAPIIRYKGTVAASTVKDVLTKTRAGHSVCLFAEGVRSWDGCTNPILPSTGRMIQKAKCGLVTYKIAGGYFASPNWSEGSGTRRGPVHGAPVGIYTKEELAQMSAEEINTIIVRDLYEDAYERQVASPKRYKGKNLAEHMENLLFICPKCGQIDTIISHGDTVSCKACDMAFRYTEYGMLEGIEHQTVRDLAIWQREQVALAAQNDLTYTSEDGVLNHIKNHKETPIAQGKVSLTPTALICGEKEILLSEISDMAIFGRHGLLFTAQKTYYELLPARHTNALKFLWLYEEYKNKLQTTQQG